MRPREKLCADIAWARETLLIAGESDQMRRLASGLYDDVDEAMADLEPSPRPVTEAELDDAIEALPAAAHDLRCFVAQFGDLWPAHVRERWLVYAEELEDRYARLKETR